MNWLTVVIRAMWDAFRLLLLAIVGGMSLAVWALLCVAVVSGRLS